MTAEDVSGRAEGDRACPPGRGIPYGLDPKDEPTHVTQVKPGTIYRCPSCKWRLTAVLRTKENRRKHFRHRKKRHECPNAYETSLHKAAEQIIKDSTEISVPAVIARYGRQTRSFTDKPRLFYFDDARLEVNLDGFTPDVILHEASSATKSQRKLLVEIYVTHRTEQRKIELIKQRELPTIEIDLSRTSRFVTDADFRQAVLYNAERSWLFNKTLHQAVAELQKETDQRLGGIGASLTAAYQTEFVLTCNKWEQDVMDAAVEDLVGVEVAGDRCFNVGPTIWQSAILSRFLRSPDRTRFDVDTALDWLDREGLLKPAFRRLLGNADRELLWHVGSVVSGFRHPRMVIEDYAGRMELYGLLSRPTSSTRAGSFEPTELTEQRARRMQEIHFWRLRMTETKEIFIAIKAEAQNGAVMNWAIWLDTYHVAIRGKPNVRIVGNEVEFRAFIDILKALRRMLRPHAGVPAAGLLGLPLEPERDARIAEQLAREDARRAEIEQRREAAERARQQREAAERAWQQREAAERAWQQREAAERARQQREAIEQRARAEARQAVAAKWEPAALPDASPPVAKKLRSRLREQFLNVIRSLNFWV